MGAGSHKVIYKAWDNSDGKLVAWNVVSIVNLSLAEQERLKAEVSILSKLAHPRLIHFYDSWTTDTEVVFITAIVGSGDLRRCVLVRLPCLPVCILEVNGLFVCGFTALSGRCVETTTFTRAFLPWSHVL